MSRSTSPVSHFRQHLYSFRCIDQARQITITRAVCDQNIQHLTQSRFWKRLQCPLSSLAYTGLGVMFCNWYHENWTLAWAPTGSLPSLVFFTLLHIRNMDKLNNIMWYRQTAFAHKTLLKSDDRYILHYFCIVTWEVWDWFSCIYQVWWISSTANP